MDALNCIETRRSVRKFEEKSVSRETVEALIAEAAMAPSWKNTQTARYVAVLDPALKAKLADECVMGFAGNAAIVRDCPALLVLATVHGRSGFERDGSYSTAKEDRWEVFDAGIAAQTLCLCAHAMGLGTVIMGIFDEEKVRAAIGLPEGQLVSALIALGYPALTPPAPKRKTVGELLSFR